MDIKHAIGNEEENRVSALLADISGLKVFRNLYVPCGGGLTSEIDLLVLSSKGVFALEIKNYGTGQIIGSERRFEWALHSKRNGVKHFYSPLKQSDKHLAAISRYLGISVGCCKGLVVFADRTELKKVPRTSSCTVLNTRYLSCYLRRCLASRKPLFSPAELPRLEQRINAIPKASDSTRKRHIAQVKEAERKRKDQQERRRRSRTKA